MSKKGSEFDQLIAMRNGNANMPADAFDTGEDDALLAKLKNITGGHASTNRAQALATIERNEIRVGAFLWTAVGLKVEGEITQEDWERTGNLLHLLDQSLQWLIGDFIVCGEDLKYGDQLKIAEMFGFEYSTIRDLAYVARNVELSVRTDNLTFTHHKLVVTMPPKEQTHWLSLAEQGTDGKRWSVAHLRAKINASIPKQLPSISDRLNAFFDAETKKAQQLIKDGASREALAQIYEKLAKSIRSAK